MVQLVKNPPANAGDAKDTGSSPGLERSPGLGNGNPLQDTCLKNYMDRGTWQATVHQSMGSRRVGYDSARTKKHKLESRLPGEIPITSDYADDTTLMAESEEELKSLLMKMKVESENVDLKLNILKTKTMASSPITSWEIDGETVETVSDFIFLGSKITADGDCSHEIKRRLLLGRKVMTNLDSIFKSRDIT